MPRIDRNSRERKTVSLTTHENAHWILISTAITRWILLLRREKQARTQWIVRNVGEPYGAIMWNHFSGCDYRVPPAKYRQSQSRSVKCRYESIPYIQNSLHVTCLCNTLFYVSISALRPSYKKKKSRYITSNVKHSNCSAIKLSHYKKKHNPPIRM
jgi:hypothetical protein